MATGPVGRPRWSGPRGKRGGKGKNKIAKAAGVARVAKVKSSSSKKKRFVVSIILGTRGLVCGVVSTCVLPCFLGFAALWLQSVFLSLFFFFSF